MKKKIILVLIVLLSLFGLAACSGGSEQAAEDEQTADTVTTASIVDQEAAFKDAISTDGSWIIATLNDLSFEETLTVEGEFHDKGNSENDLYRKIAPYAQDDNYNVTERYTISAPEMIIKSPNTRFQAGTFEGDIIVEANGFMLDDAEVDGNIYFADEEYQNSAEISENSEVSGNIEIQN